MVSCAIVGCTHKQGKHLGVRFFSVPTVITNQCAKTWDLSRRRRAEWIARINRIEITDITVRKHHKVCGKHFLQGHPASLFDPNNQDWVPSQALGFENTIDITSNRISIKEEDPLSITPEALSVTPQVIDYNADEDLVATDHLALVTSDLSEEITVDSKDWKVNLNHVACDEPRVMDACVQTCPSVIYTSIKCKPMADTSIQVCPSVIDVSAQARICCDENDKLKTERDALIQNVVCLDTRLSESVFEAESFEKCLIEKNASLAEKNLKIHELESKIKQLESTPSSIDNCELKKIMLNEENFRTDDKKVSFYSGLPTSAQLMHVFNLISENIRDSTRYTLTKFQQFLMMIMWLRLGLEEQDLAYRFGLSQSSVSRHLYRWLIPTSALLERFIVWPNRETQQTSMPLCFQQNWKNAVAVIIDSFEVFTGRSMYRQTGASSHDNHQNKIKFIVGITPQGAISFISKSFAGHKSDEHIIKHSGLLNKLLPGDVIIDDQSCNIVNAEGHKGTRTTTKGKPQLSLDNSELTREIAHVRIQVKKVTGLLRRKYKILSGILPLEVSTKKPGEDFAPIDHVARVCCALINVYLSVVPLE